VSTFAAAATPTRASASRDESVSPSHEAFTVTLMNPGPAISSFSTMSDASRAAMSFSATSRGLDESFLARPSAQLACRSARSDH
jgi:hypothetical protein